MELQDHQKSVETYALQGLSKGYVVKTCMQERVMNEKQILLMTTLDFIIRLVRTNNSPQVPYFLLKPSLGCVLYATYNRTGLYVSERHATPNNCGSGFVCSLSITSARHEPSTATSNL